MKINEVIGMPERKVIDGVYCYGKMAPEQNTHIVTDDDEWIMPRGFRSWQDAVRYVKRRHPDVVEMSAV